MEFATHGNRDSAQVFHKVTAKREIVLSAGSIGTPQILLNSGIGDSAELQQFNIKPLVDLPSVGRNLTDHPIGVVQYVANSTDTYDSLNNETFVQEQFESWKQTHKGIMAGTVANTVGLLRLSDNATIFEQTLDPASGPGAAHFELIFHVSWLEIVTRFFELNFSLSERLCWPYSGPCRKLFLHELGSHCTYFSCVTIHLILFIHSPVVI